jgi:hypothetical protein
MAGIHIRTGAADTFLARLEAIELPGAVASAIAPCETSSRC